jgi:hypothetical protein
MLAVLVVWASQVATGEAGGDGASGIPAAPLGHWGAPSVTLSVPAKPEAGCVGCHPGRDRGHEPGHVFAQRACTACHAGDATASAQEAAHRGLVAYPGTLDNAARTCGTCHPAQLAGVLTGPMATLRNMVPGTRRAFGEDAEGKPGATAGQGPDAVVAPDPGLATTPVAGPGTADGDRGPALAPLSGLGHSPADSLLRKLCVSCHLGQPKTRHALDPVRDRGGGCLACHLNAYPPGAHAEVSARVRDERCFGCHSRSSRIALAYAGLAEVDEGALARPDRSTLGRLPDGRLVEQLPADVHHRAGLRCVDCHRGAEVMNLGAARATCEACHGPSAATGSGSASEAKPGRDPAGTPKAAPLYRPESHPLAREHARLTCAACHSQWAPQCFGCHIRFDAAGEQWDHHERRGTPGRWVERRWNVRNGLPTLALDTDERIRPVVPGMVRTAEHPAWEGPQVRSHFRAIAPHTIGRARACETCHPVPPTREDP